MKPFNDINEALFKVARAMHRARETGREAAALALAAPILAELAQRADALNAEVNAETWEAAC